MTDLAKAKQNMHEDSLIRMLETDNISAVNHNDIAAIDDKYGNFDDVRPTSINMNSAYSYQKSPSLQNQDNYAKDYRANPLVNPLNQIFSFGQNNLAVNSGKRVEDLNFQGSPLRVQTQQPIQTTYKADRGQMFQDSYVSQAVSQPTRQTFDPPRTYKMSFEPQIKEEIVRHQQGKSTSAVSGNLD